MPHTQTERSRPAIRLRADRWLAECNSRGLTTDTARGRAFGIDRTQIINVQNGDKAPGAVFVACVLTTLRCRFEDIFEAVK